MNIFAFIQLCRPGQWIKNTFVLAGLLFAHSFGNSQTVFLALGAFVGFCLVSSSVYALNDVMDVASDQNHPQKKNRPIASGILTKGPVLFFAAGLFCLALLVGYAIRVELLVILCLYGLLNMAYTFHLKRMVLLDVFCIALGFMLRMLAGTVGIGITPSHWIIMCTLMISLFLGFSKRYAEMNSDLPQGRSVLSDYSKTYLSMLLGIATSCTILMYALYTINERTLSIHGSGGLIYTLPLVIYGMFRYLYLVVQKGQGEDPTREIFCDKQICITVLLYVGATFWIVN